MLAALIITAGFFLGQTPPSAPPEQPATGPGGLEYVHTSVTKTYYELPFEGATDDEPQKGALASFWIFEPTQPPLDKAPVVAFFHGFGAGDPAKYGAWIDHLVRRGKIVVYPLYQSGPGFLPDPASFTEVALATFARSLEVLTTGAHASPDLERIAFCGHSIGGLVAVEVAALAPKAKIPSPRALMAIEPGSAVSEPFGDFPEGDLSTIPAGTLLLTLSGDADSIAGDIDARRIYRATTSIPKADKDVCVLHSDNHGHPALSAHHLTPLAVDSRYKARSEYGPSGSRLETDALDFYGPWKLFDALCDTAFEGIHREYALGNTPEQRYMGIWSDGQAVIEMDVLDL